MKSSSIKGLVSGVVLAGALGMSATTASAGWSANVAMTSDYRYRGIAQSDESFAIQGGFDYAHDNGFYAGVWGSNVDFEIQTVDDAQAELDIYGGVSGEFGNGLGWDVGIIRYEYPGADNSLNYDFTEVYGSLSYSMFTASLSKSGEWFGKSGSGTYFNIAVDGEIGGFGVGAAVGHQSLSNNANWGTPDWTDTKLYVSKEVGGFGLEVAYTDTNLSKNDCFGGSDWCDGRLVFTVSKSFE